MIGNQKVGVIFLAATYKKNRHLASLRLARSSRPRSLLETDRKGDRTGKEGLMASNYVDATEEAGRFHGHYSSSTTPTGAAASPKTKRRGWPGSASAPSGAGGHGPAPKCVCAPPTHAGSFKCRLHRTSSHGGGHGSHPSSSPPSPANAAPPHPAAPSSSSRTVAAQ